MTLQTLQTLLTPKYAVLGISIATLFGSTLLYLDEFLFLTPYLTFHLSIDRVGTFVLDIALLFLTGIVMTNSLRQIRIVGIRKIGNNRLGLAGIFGAFLAGACPCYYLLPLLTLTGAAGGVLGALGIMFYAYQLPVKLASVGLLAFTTFGLERSLRVSCSIQLGLVSTRFGKQDK